MSTSTEPRSVRLTQAHRADMVSAVMAEWEKQNPQPCQESNLEILMLAIKEIKKHPDYKMTQKLREAVPAHQHGVFNTTSHIVIQFRDENGDVRNTEGGFLPLSLAAEHGLDGVGSHSIYGSQLMDVPIPDEDIVDPPNSTYIACRYSTFCYLTQNNSMTVQLSDTSPAMKKIKGKREQLKGWNLERDRLKSETADLLAQFNTTRQIREGWPEMVNYMPPHIADPDRAVTLPVLSTSRLSERLGIATP